MRVGILPTRGKHMHDRIISLSGDAWVLKSSLMSPLSIEVPYHARKLSTHLFVCYVGTVPTV